MITKRIKIPTFGKGNISDRDIIIITLPVDIPGMKVDPLTEKLLPDTVPRDKKLTGGYLHFKHESLVIWLWGNEEATWYVDARIMNEVEPELIRIRLNEIEYEPLRRKMEAIIYGTDTGRDQRGDVG